MSAAALRPAKLRLLQPLALARADLAEPVVLERRQRRQQRQQDQQQAGARELLIVSELLHKAIIA